MTPRVLVTRPEPDADELCALLRARGVEPVAVPTIAVDYSARTDAVDTMLSRSPDAAWLIFTSAHAVAAVIGRAGGRGLPAGRVAAVGPRTADALRANGIRVDLVPPRFVSTAIADELGDVTGQPIVIAGADTSSGELAAMLRRRHASVEEVATHRVVAGPESSRAGLDAALREGAHGLAFTSGSTVRGLLRLARGHVHGDVRRLPAFCIGPPTADTARRLGFAVTATASVHTALGLADLIHSYFEREES